MTTEERVKIMVQRKIKEHNEVSATIKYAGDRTDYYKGRLTELQDLLIEFVWQFGIAVDFVIAVDERGNEYEKAVSRRVTPRKGW